MRRFAWGLVIAGAVVVALGTPIVMAVNYSIFQQNLRWWSESWQGRLPFVCCGWKSEISLLIPVGTGVALAGFGTLLLAIRPPERKKDSP